MCGPSQAQEQLAGQEASFSQLLSSNYQSRFGAQSQVLQNLNNMLTPIAQAGPDQQGFGPQELAALNTESGQGVGATYSQAQQAVQTQLASQGGGNEVLPTGASAVLRGNIANAASSELSQERLGITRANYAQGRQNWQQAEAGLHALSGEYDPNAIAGETTSANQGAFGEATKVQQMKNQRQAAIAGGIASLAGDALTFGMGGFSNLASGGAQAGSETGGGVEQFFSGGLSALHG